MGQRKVVYIGGPITGVRNYWEPFEKAEDELSAMGYIVLTPTRLPWNIDNGKAMRICLAMIDQADAVYFLPGSSNSEGANLEAKYCRYVGKPFTTDIEKLREVLA